MSDLFTTDDNPTSVEDLRAQAIALHEAARLLFLAADLELPTWNMQFRDKLRVDISLRINEACVDFVHEAPDGSRGILKSVVVPVPPHSVHCECVQCEATLRQAATA